MCLSCLRLYFFFFFFRRWPILERFQAVKQACKTSPASRSRITKTLIEKPPTLNQVYRLVLITLPLVLKTPRDTGPPNDTKKKNLNPNKPKPVKRNVDRTTPSSFPAASPAASAVGCFSSVKGRSSVRKVSG